MNMMRTKYGFTLLELLLVVVVMVLTAAAVAPYFGRASRDVSNIAAEKMVKSLIAKTKAMAIAGRTNESKITFEADGRIRIGDTTYKLPAGRWFFTGGKTNTSLTFNLEGKVTNVTNRSNLTESQTKLPIRQDYVSYINPNSGKKSYKNKIVANVPLPPLP